MIGIVLLSIDGTPFDERTTFKWLFIREGVCKCKVHDPWVYSIHIVVFRCFLVGADSHTKEAYPLLAFLFSQKMMSKRSF